jgi:hypothetical protein
VSGDGHGQGAIFHAGTTHVAAPEDPAAAGENLDIYCTGLNIDSAIPPQVAIGGRMAAVQRVSQAPGVPGVNQVRVRVPTDIEPGPAVPVRLSYVDRPSNEVTIAVRGEDAPKWTTDWNETILHTHLSPQTDAAGRYTRGFDLMWRMSGRLRDAARTVQGVSDEAQFLRLLLCRCFDLDRVHQERDDADTSSARPRTTDASEYHR